MRIFIMMSKRVYDFLGYFWRSIRNGLLVVKLGSDERHGGGTFRDLDVKARHCPPAAQQETRMNTGGYCGAFSKTKQNFIRTSR